VSKHQEDRIGLLVIRAFIEDGPRRRLLVKLLEVNSPGPDRIIGIVDSSAAASRLVGDWLISLERDTTSAGSAQHHPVEGDR
jgi:hypothetical protein